MSLELPLSAISVPSITNTGGTLTVILFDSGPSTPSSVKDDR